jgi:hypothetical protein
MLQVALGIVRERQHLSIYQAYYQLNKDKISHAVYPEWRKHVASVMTKKELLELQATA